MDATGDGPALVDCPRGTFCRETTPTAQTLHSVWARSVDDVWAVGDAGVVLHRTGGVWRAVPSGTTDTLRAVWAAPDSDRVVIAGLNARLIRLANESITGSTAGGPALTGVWGFDSSRIYVVGDGPTLLLGDGTTFVDDTTGVVGTLTTIWGSSGPDDVWVGSISQDLVRGRSSGSTASRCRSMRCMASMDARGSLASRA